MPFSAPEVPSVPGENDKVAPQSRALGNNPKDLLGATKPDMTKIPAVALLWESLAMMDGAGKYKPYNWRANKVIASIYIAAVKRHLDEWFEGVEFAGDSGCHHLGHARAGLGILLDAQATGNMIDDRPITEGSSEAYLATMKTVTGKVPAMLERHRKFHAEKSAREAEKRKINEPIFIPPATAEKPEAFWRADRY